MLGVNRYNIKKGVKKWILLDIQNDAFWLINCWKKHLDSLDEDVANLVVNWWENKPPFPLTWRMLWEGVYASNYLKNMSHINIRGKCLLRYLGGLF